MEDTIKISLQITAKTWLKDTHGLFDYEIKDNINQNNLTVTGSGSLITVPAGGKPLLSSSAPPDTLLMATHAAIA